MIHLYCGDGKGKTTAASGLAVRAAGRGKSVLFAQFMKSTESGEVNILSSLKGVTVMRAGGDGKFEFMLNAEEKKRAAEENGILFENIKKKLKTDKTDVIILDEAVTAVERGMLDEDSLRDFVNDFRGPEALGELVLTGSVPEAWMIEVSDYVTDMEKIKHPFDRGYAAREGIEY